MGVFSRMSGLDKLAKAYPAIHEPGGKSLTKQTVQVGAVRYRRCVTVSVNQEGLHLWVQPALSSKAAVSIPWGEIQDAQQAMLYWKKAVRMSIGNPKVGSITLPMDLFKQVEPHLPPELAARL